MSVTLFTELKEEIVNFLSGLVKINTSNPPGNETAAARYLAEFLKMSGMKTEIIESAPGRGNFIARLPGNGTGPRLLLLSHLDVVPAKPEEWKINPWDGQLREGFIWGRGTVDCKNLVTMEAFVFKLIAEKKLPLRGDLILAATADEEMGGEWGVKWLVENCYDKIAADFVINEGAEPPLRIGGKDIFTVQTAEKGPLWLKILVEGIPGHASLPGIGDNAILKMNQVLQRLQQLPVRVTLHPVAREFLQGIADTLEFPGNQLRPDNLEEFLHWVSSREPALAELMRSMTRTTITPTVIQGGNKENVIPSSCEITLDCRVMPGESPDFIMKSLREALRRIGPLKVEFWKGNPPGESSPETDLFHLIRKVITAYVPKSQVLPTMVAGATDSRYLRPQAVCYGLELGKADLPPEEMVGMIHGVNERISVDNLIFGTSVLYEIVRRFLTA